jgi:plasmid stabilization system protein ParE
MKRMKVSIPPEVQKQILEQVLYIATDSIKNALAWEDRVRATINSIGELPPHAVDEDASRRVGETIRKVVFEKTYLIHYRINDATDTVEIVNFRHGARLPGRREP